MRKISVKDVADLLARPKKYEEPRLKLFDAAQLALPYCEHIKPEITQDRFILQISFPIALQLRSPIFWIGLGYMRDLAVQMLVPKATMDEYDLPTF